MPNFTSVVHVNSLFWITSLDLGEQGPTRRILEDLEPYLSSAELPFQIFEPKKAAEFLAGLDLIAKAAQEGMRPMLHLDAHGSQKQGIQIAASGEFVPWETALQKLRAINIATGNNLCVVSAACFGMQVARRIRPPDPAPFFLLIASDEEVNVGFIGDKTTSFYKDVFENEDIVRAYDKHLRPALQLFHCERLLATAIVKLWRERVGKAGDKAREDMLTGAFQSGIPNTRYSRRLGRSIARRLIKPSQEFIDLQVQHFLMGKPVGFNMQTLTHMIEEERSEMKRRLNHQRKLEKAGRSH
jgi:hypothetical protein